MNYEKMSDEYINTEVLRVLYGDVVDYWSPSDCGAYLYDCMPVGDAFYKIELKDYCNNPADAWPLIAENRINIDFQYGEWPTAEYPEYIYTDKNPLRAAMTVFLKMQEHKEPDK